MKKNIKDKDVVKLQLDKLQLMIESMGASAVVYSPSTGIYSMYKNHEAKLMIHNALLLEIETDRQERERDAYIIIQNRQKNPTKNNIKKSYVT